MSSVVAGSSQTVLLPLGRATVARPGKGMDEEKGRDRKGGWEEMCERGKGIQGGQAEG